MSDIPSLSLRTAVGRANPVLVANLTREDGRLFMKVAAEVPVRTYTTVLPLDQANEALSRLRAGEVEGALVLCP